MQRFFKFILFAGTLSIYFPINAQKNNTIDFDAELYAQIVRQSAYQYGTILKSRKVLKDHNHWKKPIDSAFRKLADSSGNPTFPIVYNLIQDNSFNAFAMAGGQFCINSGTLDILDQVIANSEPDVKDKLNFYRERYIAGVLSHELSHYYNKHTFNSVKKFYQLKGNPTGEVILENIKFSQDQEVDADQTGFQLLNKAGYGGEYMIRTLELMSDIDNQYKEYIAKKKLDKTSPESMTSLYFTSHPSPNDRLSRFNSDKQELYSLLATLEKTFDDIQFGKNLDLAKSNLEKALSKFPGNTHLEKSYAICLHKIWMSTASNEDLKIKPVIDMPSFRDSMLFPGGLRKRVVMRTTPGNQAAYTKAKEAYQKVIIKTEDPYFISNYAVLLSYSTEENDMNVAKSLAGSTVRAENSIPLANNFGVVLYWTNDEEKAMEIFKSVANMVDKRVQNFSEKSKSSPDVQAYLQGIGNSIHQKIQLDPDYVYENFTPILNYVLLESYKEKTPKTKQLASYYLENYDSFSGWAKYLANLQGIDLPEPSQNTKQNVFKIGGVGPGDKLEDLLKLWGQPDKIQIDKSSGNEFYIYSNKETSFLLNIGSILQVNAYGDNSPGIDKGVVIGSDRGTAEKVFGKQFQKSGPYFGYSQNGNTFVKYRKNKVDQIILQ
ncbi:M48 family metallopeptidase [Leptospira interrogans]|uniref:Peptidase, M48 domain protein n=10 Tax=Leptospira interrogans TaxID=173 RepID=A0A0E2DKT1_LEPIR|nr:MULTISPECIES: M48 family metallopeptidase [Leptospira]EJO77287.1 peptidase, M48 domain protein [Leptospira interrogans serovar Pomona str. Kennewicki LC82-25]EJP02150.1 peptidase, M48 domain protein [Leptospira interrogans serovar Bulgarica str. Mallika]EJP14195.1 peptidase, M48 domain protein [Leptospira interrogans str. FPW2026]EKN88005.1 peptidase, M48 domain protein [Leptospira interrogans str. 2002000624]EKN96529.1 peptidase, M48 domain protein [Leptospira interrogans serovar Pomona st